MICSTNAIESLNARFRRAVRARGHFPNEQSAMKTLYLVVRSLDPKGTGQTRWAVRWKPALNAFAITFADRICEMAVVLRPAHERHFVKATATDSGGGHQQLIQEVVGVIQEMVRAELLPRSSISWRRRRHSIDQVRGPGGQRARPLRLDRQQRP